MLYAMLATCAALIFILALAVPHAAETRRLRLARRLRVQQRWAELMNHHEEEKEDVAVVCKCSVLSTPS